MKIRQNQRNAWVQTLFLHLSSSSRVCASPALMCQLEESRPSLLCHRSFANCCGNVWGRWRPSSSGRWQSWRKRRASSTMKQQPTANARRVLWMPSWRGSQSWRKVSEIFTWLIHAFLYVHQADGLLIGQSRCKFWCNLVCLKFQFFAQNYSQKHYVSKSSAG